MKTENGGFLDSSEFVVSNVKKICEVDKMSAWMLRPGR